MRTQHSLPGRAAILATAITIALLSACSSADESSNAVSTSSTSAATPAAPSCAPTKVAVPATAKVPDSDSDIDVTTTDGTRIRAHWFPLPTASAAKPAPTVMMGPGWGLAGDTKVEAKGFLGQVTIRSLRNAGFNVLTWDPRGFGKSSGTAQADDPKFEGADVQSIISWLAAQPQVALDAKGDPRMGMTGASYGGGIQLVTAAIDCRVDAIAPIIAWNSLEASLYKNKIPKQGWASILSKSSAFGSVDPHITSAYESTVATGTISEDDQAWFRSRGPGELVSKVKVPTLIVQGMVDTLFSLDEGIANYKVISETDVPLAMVWFCGGHGICNAKTGDRERANNRIVAWLRHYVSDDQKAETGPVFDAIDQDGVRHTGNSFPKSDGDAVTATGAGTLQLIAEGGSVPPEAANGGDDPLAPVAAGIMPFKATNAVNVAIDGDNRDAMVFGAPTLTVTYKGSVEAGERPTAAFAQLIDDSTGDVIGQQLTPIALELDGSAHTAEVPLETVMFHLKPGNTVTLQLVANSSAYATPRLGGQVEFTKIGISLPTTTQLRSPR